MIHASDPAAPQSGLYRIEIKPDGSAGSVTKLETSRKLYHSDGMRQFGPNSPIMVEGETVGTLDLITISGNSAKIETVQGGFDGPVSLVQVGNVAYVSTTAQVPVQSRVQQEAWTADPRHSG